MTPEEAIQELNDLPFALISGWNERRKEALSLGVEALEHYKKAKQLGDVPSQYYLPGETNKGA